MEDMINSDIIEDVLHDLNEDIVDTQNTPIDEFKKICSINKDKIIKLVKLGVLNREISSIRSNNVGTSNYSQHLLQSWSIWLDYPDLTAWDKDVVKRILRTKEEPGLTFLQSRKLDYEKIIHICQESIRQINEGIYGE